LFKVFLHFPGSDASEYRKCMLVNLMLWAHYSNKNLPIFEMIKHNASMCNEESGELAFSVLARTIASNSSRMDIDSVNRHFILSRLKLDVANDLNLDIADSKTVLINNHHIIKADSPEVIAVGVHFMSVVNNLKINFFHHYPTKPADATFNFANLVAAQKCLVSSRKEDVKEWYISESKPVIETIIVKTKKALSGEWLVHHSELWPEAKRVVHDAKAEESSGWEEEEDSSVHPSLSSAISEPSDDEDNGPRMVVPEVKERKLPKPRKPVRKRRRNTWYMVDVESEEDAKNLADVGDSKVLLPPNDSSAYALRNRYHRSARPTQPMILPGSDHEDRFFEEAGLDGKSLIDE
jgi:hypothetical protein